jgi:hypothetical protein
VIPKRVSPLATLGMNAPAAINRFEATRGPSERVRQTCSALMTAPRMRTRAPLMLNGGVRARVSASNAWPLTT